MTVLEKVLSLAGPTADSQVLSTLVEMCMEEATEYCNLQEYTPKLDNAVVQMTLERYNRLNNEGVASTNASSIAENFIDGYSKSTLCMLNKNRKVKVAR